jgi:hypothetical protein
MSRSRRKQGLSGTRYRAHNGGKLKGRPIVRFNMRRWVMRRATEMRVRMERETEHDARRNKLRLE